MNPEKITKAEIIDKNKLAELLKEINHLRRRSQIEKSNQMISHIEALLDPGNDEIILATMESERGLNHYYQLNFDKAIETSLNALNVFKKHKDNIQTSKCLNRLGVYYSALGLENKALDHFLESVNYDPDNLPALNNVGNKYFKLNKFDKALQFLETVYNKAKVVNDTQSLVEANTDMAELHIKRNEPEKALEILSRSENVFTENEDDRELHFHLLAKGKAFLDLDNVAEARENILQAYSIAERLNNQELLWFSYKRMILLFQQLKNYKKLSEIYQKSLTLQEKIYNERMTKRITNIENVYEIEKKEFHLKQMLEKNARLASIGVMAAGITHEINQPLNAIVINSDGLLYKDNRDNVLPEDYRKSIEQILKAAGRIDEIIKHMRSFWASPQYIQYQDIELHQAIADALSLVTLQIQSHGIILVKDFCSGNPRIKANKTLIEQIIINLVNNSIHSLDNIATKSKKICITTKIEENSVILYFDDNGKGIDINDKNRIFDPFFSTKTPGEGMGLGLAIVRSFINEINGQIKLISKETQGALFQIIFPFVNGKEK